MTKYNKGLGSKKTPKFAKILRRSMRECIVKKC